MWLELNWKRFLGYRAFWLPTVYLDSVVVNYSITAVAKGHSRSATGALIETKRHLVHKAVIDGLPVDLWLWWTYRLQLLDAGGAQRGPHVSAM